MIVASGYVALAAVWMIGAFISYVFWRYNTKRFRSSWTKSDRRAALCASAAFGPLVILGMAMVYCIETSTISDGPANW